MLQVICVMGWYWSTVENLDKNTWIVKCSQYIEMISSLFTFVCLYYKDISLASFHSLASISLSFNVFSIVPLFYMSHLLLLRTLFLSIKITFGLIEFFFFYYSSWIESFRVSSYCSSVHLDNYWSYQALLSWLFIMNGNF